MGKIASNLNPFHKMQIRHTDIIIPDEDPFQNCKLNRKQYAEVLTNVVNTYSEGFVMSINNEWGTGKTTFIKMWQGYLNNLEFQTVYFNAWEHDFDSNPLVAIMSELEKLNPKENNKSFKLLVEKASIITKNVLPIILTEIAKKYLGSKFLEELAKGIGEGTGEILSQEIEQYSKKKKGLLDFKSELQKYIDQVLVKKPLIFIIDELDRCRPNYAVEVLEQIKHFFNVPGIVFVLSIDKIQLGNAIRGVYGSEMINTNEYLRRFIDLEYILPEPNREDFTKYLFKYFMFDEYFQIEERKKYNELKYDGVSFQDFAVLLFSYAKITLRQQEKIFAHARVALNSFTINNYLHPSLYVFLIYVRDFYPDFYQTLNARQESPQIILDNLKNVFPKNINEGKKRHFILVEVLLISLYHKYYSEIDRNVDIIKRDGTEEVLLIKSSLDEGGQVFLSIYKSFYGRNGIDISLAHLLNKINLTENFKINDE